MTWNEHANKSFSEKITLAWVHGATRLITWTLYSGAIYKRTERFTQSVFEDGTELTQVSSTALNVGEWFYDVEAGVLYIRTSDDSAPSTKEIRGDFRLFFSNKAIDLPHDLLSGEVVPYEPRIMSAPQASQEIDNTDLTGVSMENSGRLSLHNADGFFDNIFDVLIWENKEIEVYSYSPSEIKRLFKGIIKDKDYTRTSAVFQVKDDIYKLRNNTLSGLYSDSDGNLNASVIGKNKRVVYGRTSGLLLQSLDHVIGGYSGSGTISCPSGSDTLTGSGTQFLSELSPSDQITIVIGNISLTLSASSVNSDTSITLSDENEITFADAAYTIAPERPYYNNNRTFLVSDHKLREPTTTIASVLQLNRITLVSVLDMFADDYLTVGAEVVQIKSISGDQVNLWQNLNSSPSVGATVTRLPVSALYYDKKIVPKSLWSINNTSSFCKITIADDMEADIATVQVIKGTITFTNGSRDVSISSGHFNDVRPRDYFKSNDITHNVYYEVLQVVDETNLKLRVVYAGANYTGLGKWKQPMYVDDTGSVAIDCYGKESGGAWVKTGPDAVKDILTEVGISNVNLASFSSANDFAPAIIDIKLPLSPKGSMNQARDIITKINKSIMANLTIDENFDFEYTPLLANVPLDVETIKDDDILSYTTTSNTNTLKLITGRYRHFDYNYLSESSGSIAIQETSAFAVNYSDADGTKDVELYLYNLNDAKEVVERMLLYSSLTQTIMQLRGKLNLSRFKINNKMIVDLDRMFARHGSSNTKRIFTVSGISKNGSDTTLKLTDLGNSINRSARIAPDDASTFVNATDVEKLTNGYIVDSDTDLPDDNESHWGDNIIT